jgi:hypothetical protein
MKLNDEIHEHYTQHNQIFMFSSAELLFLKIMLQIWVLNYTINCESKGIRKVTEM